MTDATVHVLSQYAWPDDAPTGIYAEQLADSLASAGVAVRLVARPGIVSQGAAPGPRDIDRPRRPLRRPPWGAHLHGQRIRVRARRFPLVHPGTRQVERRRRHHERPTHHAVPWQGHPFAGRDWSLLAAGLLPAADSRRLGRSAGLVRLLDRAWRRQLGAWAHVVKAAGNLGYSGANAIVIRNWPTLELGPPAAPRPRTALYSGNLGWGHDLAAFVEVCRTLRDKGYEITVRGDGPGVGRLPEWIRTSPPFENPAELVRSYWNAEVHLVAGHPRFPEAIFPSKFWNAHATGRPVLASGFTGAMAEELETARQADFRTHLPRLAEFVLAVRAGCQPTALTGTTSGDAH